MIEEIRELVRIPSVTDSPYIEEVLDKALEISGRFGFKTKKIKDFLGYAEIGEGEDIIGILTHLDVVPVEGEWVHDPFDVSIDGEKIYGRGVFDDKGAIVSVMYAMKDILESERDRAKLKKRIRIIFGTHEEEGDWDDIEYYKATEELPVYGFTPDSEFPLTYAEKGLARFDILLPCDGFNELSGGSQINIVPDYARCVLKDGTVLETRGRAAHASKPELGLNAITELMKEILAHRGSGQDDDAVKFAEFYLEKFASPLDTKNLGLGFESERGGGTTVNLGKISLSEGMIRLETDIRFCADLSYREIKEALEKNLSVDDRFHGIHLAERVHAEPVYVPPEGDVALALLGAYRKVSGDETAEASLSAASTYASAMRSIPAFGPLFPGRENTGHQKDESFYIEDLYRAREVYRMALINLLEI